jgi:hypothetical protein
MMRFFIEGRQVDLTADEPLLITREIADIREPEKRASDWSKTFRIPGTSNNNKVFGHIFDVAQEQLNTGTQFAPDFNPNKKAQAVITFDEVEQVRGFVRLLNIVINRPGEVEYEVSVHGVGADFFARIRGRRLSDLDLSDLNHELTKDAIKDSWGHNSEDGYVYPMINRGRNASFYSVWAASDFVPAVFAKRVVDDIFAAAGYTYTDDSFFNSAEFKRRVIPFPKKPQLNADEVTARAMKARRSSNANFAKAQAIVYNDDSSTGFYDNGNNYNTSTGQYISPAGGGMYTVKTYLDIAITGLSDITYPSLTARFAVYVGGRFVEGFSSGLLTNNPIVGASYVSFDYVGDVYAGSGEAIEFRLENVFDSGTGLSVTIAAGYTMTVLAGSWIQIDATQHSYGVGQEVNFGSFFTSGEWTMEQFISDLIKLDNLYIEPTDRRNTLFIAPRDEFYTDDKVHDLTGLIDRSQTLLITPMAELDGNPYYFTMSKGLDVDSEAYNRATARCYGDIVVYVDNEFVREMKKIETVICSTPYIHAGGHFRIASMEAEDNAAGQLRLLYWSGKVGTVSWLLCDDLTGTSFTNAEQIDGGFPHAGHLDDPFTPTADLNFGMPQYVNLPEGISYTNNNLYNRNWRKYINEIADRNSKLVRAWVYVTPAQWYSWSFRHLYFFDGQYFRLNKVIDYPIGGSQVVQCEFLKLKTADVFAPQTGTTGGGYDQQDDNGDRWPDLRTGLPTTRRRFGYGTPDGSNGRARGDFMDWINTANDMNRPDIGTPGSGDKYYPQFEWTGVDWNIIFKQDI